MGGFLLNGCGAADTFQKLKLLKTDDCPTCQRKQQFYLAKVRMKIHVVYIPTVPLSTKYAIICDQCKTGRFVSKEQMEQLLRANEAEVLTLYDAIMNGSAEKEQELPGRTDAAGAGLACPRCGGQNPEDAVFCGFCGHRIAEIGKMAEKADPVKPLSEVRGAVQARGAAGPGSTDDTWVCPLCRSRNPISNERCELCGQPR